MSVAALLPDRALDHDEIEALRSNDEIEQLEIVTEYLGKVTSFTVEMNIKCYALCCDRDTSQWEIIASGDDFAETVAAHREWAEDDREQVTG